MQQRRREKYIQNAKVFVMSCNDVVVVVRFTKFWMGAKLALNWWNAGLLFSHPINLFFDLLLLWRCCRREEKLFILPVCLLTAIVYICNKESERNIFKMQKSLWCLVMMLLFLLSPKRCSRQNWPSAEKEGKKEHDKNQIPKSPHDKYAQGHYGNAPEEEGIFARFWKWLKSLFGFN